MKIFIITMDDPIYTRSFFKDIIEQRHQDIVGLAVAEGGRLKLGKNRSKIAYLFSLLLIMGGYHFMINALKTVFFKIKLKASKLFRIISSPSITAVAEKHGIPTWRIQSPNDPEFLELLREEEPDVIINQSQSILKQELLEIPRIGVLNRHNALLPKNRGRLTPFWVLYKGEDKTGVSIHFVEEEIDSGEIVVQKEFPIGPDDTFNTVVEKNYSIASQAMLEALEKLKQDVESDFIANDDSKATYNSVPTLNEAKEYRLQRIKHFFS